MTGFSQTRFISVLSLALLISACGGGGSSTPIGESDNGDTTPPDNTGGEDTSGYTVSVNFIKGPVSGATCTLYEVTNTGTQGASLATGTTNNGLVDFENISYTGLTLTVCNGGTYTDEATGEQRTAVQMRSVVELDGEDTAVSVTPLTEIAVGSSDDDYRDVDTSIVANAFGLANTDISEIIPTDLNTESAADDAAGRYGTVLSLISQLQEDKDQSLDQVLDALSEELEDGALSEDDKNDLTNAADNLAESEVADALNDNATQTIISAVEEITDTTPPSIAFSPSSITLEYNNESNISLTVGDGQLNGDVTCTGDLSYDDGVLSSSMTLGQFSCNANAIDGNQNTAQAALSVTVVDTTPPAITAPESVVIQSGEAAQAEISAIDEYAGELDFTMNCSGDDAVFYEGAFFSQAPGEYTCVVSATDPQENLANATIAISVRETVTNTAPIAVAGDDFSAPTGSRVDIDAGQSSDSEQNTLSYSWEITSMPADSTAMLNTNNTSQSSFVPDIDGDYDLTVTVSDGNLSNEDTITINVSTGTWVMNENSEAGAYIDALVNINWVGELTLVNTLFYQIGTSGIPSYSVEMTQDDIDTLNNRPQAANDFDTGQTSAMAGDIIEFGQDIGYQITRSGCDLDYWPPGPACPSDQQRESNIPAQPEPAVVECETSINTMGLMLNGTSVYNWSDGVSYNNQGAWQQLAPEFEIYDVDICSGHAQTQGDYHHHMFSPCLASLFNDEGQAHSPIYGYAADGYPIYGPWHAKDVLAKSSWVKRDYSDLSAGGCSDGERSCLLVDQHDLSQGTIDTDLIGPDTDEVVTSNSGNEFTVASGYYFEDYYFDDDLVTNGEEYLDEHNGHNHDALGYHYHSTVENIDGKLTPSFPYNIGPTFYGETPGGSIYTCNERADPLP